MLSRYLLIAIVTSTALLLPLVEARDLTSADQILQKLSGKNEALQRPTSKPIRVRGITPVPSAAMAASGVAQNKNAIDLTIHFKTDSTEIAFESLRQILEIAKALRQLDLKSQGLKIIGHTDSRGNAKHNADLSLRRAQAVLDALVRDYDISRNSLRVEGKGESQLRVSPERNSGDYAANRRVELQLIGGFH
ncbi:MAG: OmpA family protein [Gammaproteobacteria bacterium]